MRIVETHHHLKRTQELSDLTFSAPPFSAPNHGSNTVELVSSLLVVEGLCAMQVSVLTLGNVRAGDIMVKQDLSINGRYIVARNIDWEESSH